MNDGGLNCKYHKTGARAEKPVVCTLCFCNVKKSTLFKQLRTDENQNELKYLLITIFSF